MTTLFTMGEYAKEDDWKERANGGYMGSPAMVIHFAAYARVSLIPLSQVYICSDYGRDSAITIARIRLLEVAGRTVQRRRMDKSSGSNRGVKYIGRDSEGGCAKTDFSGRKNGS